MTCKGGQEGGPSVRKEKTKWWRHPGVNSEGESKYLHVAKEEEGLEKEMMGSPRDGTDLILPGVALFCPVLWLVHIRPPGSNLQRYKIQQQKRIERKEGIEREREGERGREIGNNENGCMMPTWSIIDESSAIPWSTSRNDCLGARIPGIPD